MRQLVAAGKPLLLEADTSLLSSSTDSSTQQVLQKKLLSWEAEVKYAKDNAGLLLSAEGKSTFPQITFAIDDLISTAKMYKSAMAMPASKLRQKRICTQAGRATFNRALKLLDQI